MTASNAPRRRDNDAVTERRPAGWQRALRWIAWLTFLGLAIANSQRASFGPLEFLALAVAIGISIWCVAKPLGGPKIEMREPTDVRGGFVARTNWALLLIGTILTIGGVGASGAIAYDLSTGRATLGEVLTDIGVFIEGWAVELFTGGGYDAELEKTHAYALFVLLIPGLLLVAYNLIPLRRRGREFRVEPDGSLAVRMGAQWTTVLDYEFATVTADGSTITFHPSPGQGNTLELPQWRVFSRDFGCRLRSEVSAEFFRRRFAERGFVVDPAPPASGNRFTAGRR